MAQALPSTGCAKIVLCLALFPERRWGVRELMRVAGLSPSQVQGELSRLHRLDVIAAEETPAGTRYRAALDREAWRCYSALVRCHAAPGEVLTRALASLENVERALIFGSFARGEHREDSDIDVLVLGDKVNGRAVTTSCLAAARLLERDVNPVVLTVREWGGMLASHHPFATSVQETPSVTLLEVPGLT